MKIQQFVWWDFSGHRPAAKQSGAETPALFFNHCNEFQRVLGNNPILFEYPGDLQSSNDTGRAIKRTAIFYRIEMRTDHYSRSGCPAPFPTADDRSGRIFVHFQMTRRHLVFYIFPRLPIFGSKRKPRNSLARRSVELCQGFDVPLNPVNIGLNPHDISPCFTNFSAGLRPTDCGSPAADNDILVSRT